MTDSFEFSNDEFLADPINERAMNAALEDIEQALLRFEKIMTRHLPTINAISRAKGGNSILKSSVTRGLANIFGVLAGGGGSNGTVFNPDSKQTNRFPASNGQFLTDLWSALKGFSGRNL